MAGRQQFLHHLALHGAEVRLAVGREDRRDRPPLARLDPLVDVLDLPVEAPAERTRQGGLAGRHEPDQVDLVGFTRTSRSSVSKNPGYDTATASAPRMCESAAGAERGDGEGHGEPVVAGRVGDAAPRGGASP